MTKRDEFIKEVLALVPDRIGEWRTVVDPGTTKATAQDVVVVPFYWHDAHKQVAAHVMASGRQIAAAKDIRALAEQRVAVAMAKVADDPMFQERPNMVWNGKEMKQRGPFLEDVGADYV